SWPRCTAEPAIIGLTNAGSCCARSCMHIEIIARIGEVPQNRTLAVQNDRELARDGDCGLSEPISLGEPHPPSLTALATLIHQRRLTPSCGGQALTAERTVGPARMIEESLTPKLGIRHQNPELENSSAQLGRSAMSAIRSLSAAKRTLSGHRSGCGCPKTHHRS